jgi:cobaltochelatase CobS
MATMKPIAKLFGVNAPETACISVREIDPAISAGAYPKINEHYVFSLQLLKKMLFFLTTDGPRKNLMLMGDTGAGKSSLVEQIATRLGIPVFAIACSGKMRLAHFVGSYRLVNGNTVWVDGPLLLAMRHDGLFLGDEMTRLDHSEQMALAHVLDSGCLTVPETGEIVTAGPNFRFIATGNSGGYGDESGAYNGEKVASSAFLDRFQKLTVDYLGEDDEKVLLASVAPALGGELIAKMVRFARRARESFVARGGDLRVTISTRSLVVWAMETVRYGQTGLAQAPVLEALGDTILNGAPETDVKTLTEVWENWTA